MILNRLTNPAPQWPRRVWLVGLAALGVPGCTATQDAAVPAPTAQAFRSEFNSAGYATILDVPPADFTPVRPADPAPLTAQQIADGQQFHRVGMFQSSVMSEAVQLSEKLRRAESGNFVSQYFDNEGDPSVVFQFLRDGPGTLRKYTKHPRFIGKTVRWSMAHLETDTKWIWDTFGKDRVIQSTGIGANTVNAEVSISESEFRDLVLKKGVTIPASVELRFQAAPVVPLINPPRPAGSDDHVPAAAAAHIRIFPRHDRPAGAVNSIGSRVKVVLKDGCFRAADRGDALVLFPFGARLFIDTQGYLAYGPEAAPGYARVGETVTFMGSVNEVTEPALVDPVHTACGPGKVIKVEGLTSAAAGDRQQKLDDEAEAVRRLRSEFGLNEGQARRAYDWIDRRQAGSSQIGPDGIRTPPSTASMIINSPPGPPVMDSKSCPPGSRVTFGLCRTPEGWLRPLPSWLAEFLEQDR